MRKKFVEIGLYVFGLLLILYALISDLVIGKPFNIGWVQSFFLLVGLFLIISGWLFKHHYTQFLFLLFFICLLFVFAYLKIQIFDLDHFRIWTDTKSYIATAILPLNQIGFWNGERPFVLPLIYKLLGINDLNYSDATSMSGLLRIQFFAGFLSWSFLAYVISRMFSRFWLNSLSVILVIMVGLGLHNSMWDKLVLSESFSNSLFIFLISIIFLFISTNTRKRGWTIIGLVSLGLVTILFLFIRDANGYFVLFGSILGFLYWLFVDKNRTQKKLLLGISLLGIIFSLAALFLMNLSTRWWAPLQHVLYDRRSSEPELADFFKKNGFELSENTSYLMDPLAFKNIDNPLNIEAKSEKMQIAKSLYSKFLITHPAYSLTAPLSGLYNFLNPNNLEYRYTFEEPPAWVTRLTNIAYPNGIWIFVVGSAICIVCLLFSDQKHKPFEVIILFLILSVFPLGMLFWHSDTVEIERHSQQLYLQSRLGFWLSILCLIDFINGKIVERKKKSDTPVMSSRV